MITRVEVLKGRDDAYPLTPELEANLERLLIAANKLRAAWGKPMIINSGYRPGHYNSDIGGAPNSTHITCEAIDIHDMTGDLKAFCTPEMLESCGLWMESPKSTPTWAHVDIKPRANRIFIP